MNERDVLNTELAALREQQAEVKRQARLLDVYRKVRYNGKILKNAVANDVAILELAMPGDMLNHALGKDRTLASRFIWVDPPASKSDPKVLEKDRRTLEAAAREYRTFGASEANLALARDVLGAGFSEHLLLQAIRSNAIRLSAPTDEERQHWKRRMRT